MRFKLCAVLHIFVLIATTQAAFKDFIIKDEKDLERFTIPNTEIYDDSLEEDSLNAWPYSDEGVGIGGSCDAIDIHEYYDTYDAEYKVGIDEYDRLKSGQIDAYVLREVIRQIKNDPSFKHLRDHLNEENIFFDQKKLSHQYVDVNAGDNEDDKYV